MKRTLGPLPLVLLSGLAVAQDPYGAGTPGTGGITPTISCSQAFPGNSQFTIDIDDAPGSALAVIVLAGARADIPFNSLSLLVDPATILATEFLFLSGAPGVAGAGSGALPLPLTTLSPSLLGATFRAQAGVVDPAGPGFGGGWTATSGIDIHVASQPQVFLGCSVAGSTDAHWGIDGFSQNSTDFADQLAFTDNLNGAVYTSDGLDLYVRGRGGLAHASLRTSTPTWSWVNQSLTSTGVSWDNATLDETRNWLWTLSDSPTTGTVELVAVDIDRTSSTYSQVVQSSTTFTSTIGNIGVWRMSPSRRFVAVPSLLGGSLHIFDTDPNSPTFMQLVIQSRVPTSPSSGGIQFAVRVRFSPNEDQVYMLVQNTGTIPAEISRFDLSSQTWIDHDPSTLAIDPIGPTSAPPIPFGSAPLGFDVDRQGRIFLCGWNNGGFAGRVTLTNNGPTYQAVTGTTSLDGARALGLDRTDRVLGISVNNSSGAAMLFFDADTLTPTGTVRLSPRVNTTVMAWR